MWEQLLDRIGDWNPQLLRELSCRLNRANLAITTMISLLIQVVLLMRPDRLSENNTPYWWQSTCEIIDTGIWWSLAIGGMYLIAKDLDREIRRNTLDLVNLTSTKPLEILFGKLLGVPILIYWAIFLVLPLHVFSLVQIGSIAPNAWVWDLVGLAMIALLYLNTLLSTIEFPLPPILLSPILSAIGWFGLTGVNECRLSQRMTGSYSKLGVYFSEEWWTISIFIINLFVVSFLLSTILSSRSRQFKSQSGFGQSWTNFICNLIVQSIYILFSGLMPGVTLAILLFVYLANNYIARQ
jgi:hypothetical protein